MEQREVTLRVEGWPLAKNEAKSLLAVGYSHAERVTRLLEATRQVTVDQPGAAFFGSRPIGLELHVSSLTHPPADATNFLGGVGDVLEVKVASNIFGVSGREMMAALIAGERDPRVLAEMARARLRAKLADLEEGFYDSRFNDPARG